MYARTYLHTCSHLCICSYHLHVYISTYIHTYIHTYICMYVHCLSMWRVLLGFCVLCLFRPLRSCASKRLLSAALSGSTGCHLHGLQGVWACTAMFRLCILSPTHSTHIVRSRRSLVHTYVRTWVCTPFSLPFLHIMYCTAGQCFNLMVPLTQHRSFLLSTDRYSMNMQYLHV